MRPWPAALSVLLVLAGCGGEPAPPDAGCTPVTDETDVFVRLSGLWDWGEDQVGAVWVSHADDGRLRLGVQRSGGVAGQAGALRIGLDGAVDLLDLVPGTVPYGGPVWGTRTTATITNDNDDRVPSVLLWRDVEADRDLLQVDWRSLWTGGRCRSGGPVDRNLVLTRDDERLWVFRQACGPEDGEERGRLHVFGPRDSDGVVVDHLGENGAPLERLHMTFSLSAAPDGSVWYLTDTEGTADDPDPRFGVRAVRRGRDGAVAAVSPLLADPDVVGFFEPGHDSEVYGPWGKATAGGAYVFHFVAFDGVDAYVSHVGRVEPDGTLSWVRTTPRGLAAAGRGLFFDRAIDEHRGGIVAVVADPSTRTDLWLWRVTAEGEEPWGEPGVPIHVGAVNKRGDPAAVYDMEVASDGDAVFVVRAVTPLVDFFEPIYAERFDAEGQPTWSSTPEGLALREGWFRGDVPWLRLATDGRGGVWVVQVLPLDILSSYTAVQHLDAAGVPLYNVRTTVCMESPGHVVSEEPFTRHSEP